LRPWARWLLAAVAGVGLTLLLNRLGVWWLGATDFASDSFYDGCAAFLTLTLPAFLAGLAVGFLAREQGLNVAALTFALFCAAGFVRPFWRIPPVSPESAHSGGMHYFLYNPLVALAFAALGAWLASQFATGKWTLADPQPVSPQE
jgi:hypothetical protein